MRLEERVIKAARASGVTLSVAESCTGGLVAARLVSVAGASEALLGGFVTYTDEMKRHLLGVCEQTLAVHTAVSEPVAREMAEGARLRTGSDVAVSVTGLAGPGGGTAGIPVGRVFIALATKGGTRARCYTFRGGRARVRGRAARAALSLMLSELESKICK